jgi:mono/diheme cytochrome c family protein
MTLKRHVLLMTAVSTGYAVLSPSAAFADAAAGKATFSRACAECHDAGDFDGDDPAQLAASIRAIAAGEQKHRRPIRLSAQEIADIATYMAAGGK